MNLFALASPRRLDQLAVVVAGPSLAHQMMDMLH